MKYTLYYQPQTASNQKIAVATSDSLLELCKIKYMTFHNRMGFPYIVETANANKKDAFLYGGGCLPIVEYTELVRFVDRVNAGSYYTSYDYSQRVRALLNGRK